MNLRPNPLQRLYALGQSLWLDYIRRDLVPSGRLQRMIAEDGLRGMTSNPSIFGSAISTSHDYDADIQRLVAKGKGALEVYEALSQQDVQLAADAFRRLYDASDGGDGFVSLEVNPHLAHDTDGTIREARRLWAALNRPNVFIKVPATTEGLLAIERLIGEGININITLLFGLPRYRQVAEAYLRGIEARLAANGSARVASVASFFISRIDVAVDRQLGELIAKGGAPAEIAAALRGQVAIACAKTAYQIHKEMFSSARFRELATKGARIQRLLWASTGSKNPDDSDVKYIEALIGPDTVNTAPLETIDAYRDHGDPQARLELDVPAAASLLERLRGLGIDLDAVTQRLETEGVAKFEKPFDDLLAALTAKSSGPAR